MNRGYPKLKSRYVGEWYVSLSGPEAGLEI